MRSSHEIQCEIDRVREDIGHTEDTLQDLRYELNELQDELEQLDE